MLQGLLVGVLELEELGAEGARLLLRGLQLRLRLLVLLLPLGQDLRALQLLTPAPSLRSAAKEATAVRNPTSATGEASCALGTTTVPS